MPMLRITSIAAVVCAATPLTASADPCPVGALTLEQQGGFSYDPSLRFDQIVRLRISPDAALGDDACFDEGLSLAFKDDMARFAFSGATLDAAFSETATGLKVIDGKAVLESDVIDLLRSGAAVTLEALELPFGQLEPAGQYLGDIVLISKEEEIVEASLATTVVAAVTLADGSTSAHYDISFGEPEPLKTVSSSFFFNTNGTVFVSGRAENDVAEMVHELGREWGVIPYTVTINGQSLDARGLASRELDASFGETAVAEVVFQIQEFGPLFAGKYNDIYTITLSAF